MALLITCLVLGAVLLGGFVVHIAVMLAASRKGRVFRV